MGVKIMSKSYLPELYAMGNFSEEITVNSWSLLHGNFSEDRLSKNGQCYNSFVPRSLQENTDFDREILRQTMLKQENVFRKQVVELHRLYKVQRNLMSEIQRGGGYKYPVQNLMTLNNVLSSTAPSFDTQIILQQNLPGTSSSSCGPSVQATVKSETLNFPKERRNSEAQCLTVNGIVSDKAFFSAKQKRLPKRPFDLQLPAEEYIDIENDSESNAGTTPELHFKQTNIQSSNQGSNLETEMKLTLGVQNEKNPGLILQRPPKFLADLNEPVHESEIADVDDSASARPTYSLNNNENKSAYLGISMNSLKHSHLEMKGKRIEWLSHCTEPEDNSLLVSSWKRLASNSTSSPVTAKTLPHLKELASVDVMSKFSYTSGAWNLNRSARSASHFADDASRLSDFRHASALELGGSSSKLFPVYDERDLDARTYFNTVSVGVEDQIPRKLLKGTVCKDLRSTKEINLNISLPNGVLNGVSLNKVPSYLDDEETVKGLSGGPVWLKAKPANHPEKGACLDKYPLLPSISCVSDIYHGDVQKLEVADVSCVKNIYDYSFHKKPFWHTSLAPLVKQNVNDSNNGENGFHAKLPQRVLWPNPKGQVLENESQFVKSAKGLGFDLNMDASGASCTECNQLEISSNNVAEISVPDVSKDSMKGCIDLEASPMEDMFSVEEEPIASDKFTTSSNEIHSKLTDAESALVQSAAEAIVTLSSDLCEKVDLSRSGLPDMTCSASICDKASDSLNDLFSSLSWFAELVSNQASDNETNLAISKVGINHEQSGEDSDYFEEMTLRLSQVDVSEYCNISLEIEGNKEEAGLTSLLTRPRKGNSRRGRQKRDFQKDILPGLVTLSRHEVTEDLQTLGGLMIEAGSSCRIGRNTRNGSNGKTRGRRRSRGSSLVDEPLPWQPSIGEVELEGMCLQGWGKTTRRGRRQRYPTVNVTSLLT